MKVIGEEEMVKVVGAYDMVQAFGGEASCATQKLRYIM